MQKPAHVAIAGGGIIGLSCAVTLRQRGVRVTLFEAGIPMQEASWAAGGMLASDDPANPPALLTLSRYSRSCYESFLREVVSLSGLPVSLLTRETLQFEKGEEPQLLSESSLNPRDLCVALPAAARACGVVLRDQERVLSVEDGATPGVLVRTARQTLRADAFLNCAGAWTTELTASVPVAPRKGQMLAVQEPREHPLTRVLRSPGVYLIPRGDGRIVIGATVEDAGYSKDLDEASLLELRRLAAALWPPIADAPVVDGWAGLRPTTVDHLPVIGRIGGSARFVASGHYRNGILLAPGTAEAVAALLCGVAPPVDLAPFSPTRASLSAACDKQFAAAL